MHYVAHKREYMEKRMKPKWDPASLHGGEFSEYGADIAKLHMKSLLPLDHKPLQDKPFLRTAIIGDKFSHTVGSII